MPTGICSLRRVPASRLTLGRMSLRVLPRGANVLLCAAGQGGEMFFRAPDVRIIRGAGPDFTKHFHASRYLKHRAAVLCLNVLPPHALCRAEGPAFAGER